MRKEADLSLKGSFDVVSCWFSQSTTTLKEMGSSALVRSYLAQNNINDVTTSMLHHLLLYNCKELYLKIISVLQNTIIWVSIRSLTHHNYDG